MSMSEIFFCVCVCASWLTCVFAWLEQGTAVDLTAHVYLEDHHGQVMYKSQSYCFQVVDSAQKRQ